MTVKQDYDPNNAQLCILYISLFDTSKDFVREMLGTIPKIIMPLRQQCDSCKDTIKQKKKTNPKTSKFHREFMSPALFLFELLKMGNLTRG